MGERDRQDADISQPRRENAVFSHIVKRGPGEALFGDLKAQQDGFAASVSEDQAAPYVPAEKSVKPELVFLDADWFADLPGDKWELLFSVRGCIFWLGQGLLLGLGRELKGSGGGFLRGLFSSRNIQPLFSSLVYPQDGVVRFQ